MTKQKDVLAALNAGLKVTYLHTVTGTRGTVTAKTAAPLWAIVTDGKNYQFTVHMPTVFVGSLEVERPLTDCEFGKSVWVLRADGTASETNYAAGMGVYLMAGALFSSKKAALAFHNAKLELLK